ncbi:alanine dehydrogenase [Paenibacillus jamilae]|uniref:alanine dehydrogenase n=1 Tax=Paenibacillus jamilae TaxID=114136 RepID=UPI003D2C80EC
MKIGVPKEIKNNENRVAMTPAGVMALKKAGHEIYVETAAGLGSGFLDDDFKDAGAIIQPTAKEVWDNVELIIKIKEPLTSEFQYFRDDLLLFTYLHLAAEPDLAKALIDSKMTAIAYETIENNGTLPLLHPMSEVAGRMAAQIGAQYLEKNNGGQGILLGGVPGVKRGKVTIVGAGVVGTNAAKIAIGLGAEVTIIDLRLDRLRQLDDIFGTQINTLVSNPFNIDSAVTEADLVIGAVLIPGAKAPRLVTEDMVKRMKPGSVIIDVAVDQGGIVETADKVTTHEEPTYVKHGILHYAVANMPGAVPRTSTIALTNATLPYLLEISHKGMPNAALENASLLKGVNTAGGFITYEVIAKDLGYSYVSYVDSTKVHAENMR